MSDEFGETYPQEYTGIIAEYIRANNENLIDGIYEAMVMAIRDGGFSMQIDGREFGRIIRETGVAMA